MKKVTFEIGILIMLPTAAIPAAYEVFKLTSASALLALTCTVVTRNTASDELAAATFADNCGVCLLSIWERCDQLNLMKEDFLAGSAGVENLPTGNSLVGVFLTLLSEMANKVRSPWRMIWYY
uniref:Uncharacterized protein n=1 Tax=Rhodnius prolixus TaxID=13249 RepID=T1HPV6_RHOPR